MKMRKMIFLLAASLLLSTLVANPALADSKPTEFTGTIDFVNWVNPVPPVVTPGGTIHEQVVTQWTLLVSDPRFTGLMTASGRCTWPHEKSWAWGPCHMQWTLDSDADQQPDWEGAFNMTAQNFRVFWSGYGHGVGKYAGLKMTFKVTGEHAVPAPVIGWISSE